MLKEYLEELKLSNQEEINRLEKQLSQSVQDLECGKEWLENLQKEQNMDTNIFSPRSQNQERRDKLELARRNVEDIKGNIEIIREKMEELIKKRNEYDNLMMEAENQSSSRIVEEKSKNDPKTDLASFLTELHKKTDICLALLNGDKNKCRNELRAIKKQIREYAEQIEKREI